MSAKALPVTVVRPRYTFEQQFARFVGALIYLTVAGLIAHYWLAPYVLGDLYQLTYWQAVAAIWLGRVLTSGASGNYLFWTKEGTR